MRTRLHLLKLALGSGLGMLAMAPIIGKAGTQLQYGGASAHARAQD
jgi:hypothetical protein